MAHVIEDRVLETTTTTGTGDIALAGVVVGFVSFASLMSNGDTCDYVIEAVDSDGVPTGDFEVGVGTKAAGVLQRTIVRRSSNTNALVNFAAGTKRVFISDTSRVSGISGLTEDATPDLAADFVTTYDTSAAALKKVKLSNVGVTSVALAMPTAVFDVSGSPITSSGTITVTLDVQTPNFIFAGPTGGGAAVPTFRALVAADLPSHAHTSADVIDFNEAAQDAVGGILVDSTTIDFTYSDVTPSITAIVIDGSITYAKMQDVSATDRLLGRSTAGSGDVEEIVCTAAGRALLDDVSAAAQATTLGLGTGDSPTHATLNLTATTNQIVLDSGAAFTGTITMAALGAARTWTLPNSTGTIVLTGNAGTLSNKTLDNTNTITVKDTLFTIQDDGDATKLLAFQLAGFTTSTTRTLTPPNQDGTIAVLERANTFTVGPQTVNTSGTAKGIVVNNAGTGNSLEIQEGGIPRVRVESDGDFHVDNGKLITAWAPNAAQNMSISATNTTGVLNHAGNDVRHSLSGTPYHRVSSNMAWYGSAYLFGFGSGTNPSGTLPDVGIHRSAAGVMVVNAGTTATYGQLICGIADAGTATVPTILTLRHDSSGTPGTGFGTTLEFQAESSTTVNRTQAKITADWNVATDATRTADLMLYASDSAGDRLGAHLRATGTVVQLGFFGVTPVSRPSAYTQTYATADKTHANLTSATLTDSTTGTADTTVADVGAAFSQATLNNNFADLTAQVNALRVDLEDVKQLVNSLIDDLQALGLVT